jgi:cystathionine gamma-synthase
MQDCLTTPIAQTSAYTFRNTQQLIDFCEDRFKSYEYGRYGNPTTRVLQDKICVLEGGEDALFSASGMNSTTCSMLALLPPGGKLMMLKGGYRITDGFSKNFLGGKMGCEISEISHDMGVQGMCDEILEKRPDILYGESPQSPFMRVLDIKKISAACKEAGTILIIDATLATPMNQQTVSLGADIVIHSATKYLAGHNDVLGGVCVGKKEYIAKIRTLHAIIGGVADPHAAYLSIRGLKTLGIRIDHQNRSALELAQYLASVPQVERVYYPGLSSHPDYDTAKVQMKQGGGVVSFVIRGGQAKARKFMDALRVPYIAASFGGVESLVEMPSVAWGMDETELDALGIPQGLVRFSLGLEDTVDVLSDVSQALKASSSP